MSASGIDDRKYERWILDELRKADGTLPPAALLMPEDRPSEFDSESLQFAFWGLLSSGKIRLNPNRSVSLAESEAECRDREILGLRTGSVTDMQLLQ